MRQEQGNSTGGATRTEREKNGEVGGRRKGRSERGRKERD